MPAMKLKEIGEFELIERMAAAFRQPPGAFPRRAPTGGLTIGIGDDAAVWSVPASGFAIATTDAMVEGTHFTAQTTNWYDLGWKAMASNVSDIAGMGGVPRYGLAVLAAPGDLEVENVLQLCRGMADLADSFDTAVVGGDTVSSPLVMITVTLIGESLPGAACNGEPPILSRFRARPGDRIAVTGKLGSSAGGLDLLLRGAPLSDELDPLIQAHRRPMPRVKEGQLLVRAGVCCGMDLSDGLTQDLLRVCRASGVAALIDTDTVPMDPALRGTFGARALELAVSGGEDYELLAVAPASIISEAQELLAAHGAELTVVGEVVEPLPGGHSVMLRDPDGRLRPPPRSGWEHFSASNDAARG